jgi:hypothetical protein
VTNAGGPAVRLTAELRRADIRERQGIAISGSAALTIGTQIHVSLSSGGSGTLEVTRQVRSDTWLLRWSGWSGNGSALDGRTFELGRLAAGNGKYRLRLVMPRLTREERANVEAALCEWQAPADMLRLV